VAARAGKLLAVTTSVAVLVISGGAWATYRTYNGKITRLDAIPTTGNQAIGPSGTAAASSPHKPGVEQNILVIGDDSRNGLTAAQLAELATQSDGGGVNTDTMMLVHIPADGTAASVVSLPRDLWVDVPGAGHHKLNDAYNIGSNARSDRASRTDGFRLLIQTVSQISGLHIDHFVEVNLWGFYSISKAVGGITVNLCKAVDDPYSGVKLPAGKSKIEGTQALAFVRQRHGLPGGDLDRVRRQQYFIGAVFRKIESAGVLLNPVALTRLLDSVTKVLSTDPGLDPIDLADQLHGLTAGQLRFSTIPVTGTPRIDGQDVITYDATAVHAFFAGLTRPTTTTTTKPTPTTTTAKPTATGHTSTAPTRTPRKSTTTAAPGDTAANNSCIN
jgi:LCP family protein required for cell wall assembly